MNSKHIMSKDNTSTSLNIRLLHQRTFVKSQHIPDDNTIASNAVTFNYAKEFLDPATYNSHPDELNVIQILRGN